MFFFTYTQTLNSRLLRRQVIWFFFLSCYPNVRSLQKTPRSSPVTQKEGSSGWGQSGGGGVATCSDASRPQCSDPPSSTRRDDRPLAATELGVNHFTQRVFSQCALDSLSNQSVLLTAWLNLFVQFIYPSPIVVAFSIFPGLLYRYIPIVIL